MQNILSFLSWYSWYFNFLYKNAEMSSIYDKFRKKSDIEDI